MAFFKTSARNLLLIFCMGAGGCDEQACPSDRFQVLQTGTCANGPQYIELISEACNIRVVSSAETGLPTRGAMEASDTPLRQGNFILFSDAPNFRLCHATRVDFQLNLSCVDAHGAPACEAVLTEPP